MKRYQFIPDTIWINGDDGWLVPLRRSEDPQRWMEICESDEPIVTQVDDGKPEDGKGIFPTSSSSSPSVMRRMLEALDLKSGMKVLEIGTGTGYNAAMLAEIAGTDTMTTIEVDAEIARLAEKALQKAGFPITVVTGDGSAGYAEHAPYDRVIATAAVQRIPHAWVAQTRARGRIVAPWASAFAPGGVLVALTVRDNATAIGHFGPDVGFMYLRQQRSAPVPWIDDERKGDYTETTTDLRLREPFDPGSDAMFAIGARIPGLLYGETIDDKGEHVRRLSHHASGSWASFTPGHTEHLVRQHGTRRLWTELESAYAWWVGCGRPEPTRFGLTVSPAGQQVWLDSPDNAISPP